MKKAVAIYDGFVGHHGQAIQLIGGQAYPVDASIVKAQPQHFQFSDDGAEMIDNPHETPAQKVDRLRAELKQAEQLAVAEGGSEDEGEELPPYSEWLLADLQAECKDRGVPYSGAKADLVKRLEDWDAAHPDGE